MMKNLKLKAKRQALRACLMWYGFRRVDFSLADSTGSYSETWKGRLGTCNIQWPRRRAVK